MDQEEELTASGGSPSQAVSAAPPASRGHSLQDSSRPESLTGDESIVVVDMEGNSYTYPGDKETMDMIWDNSVTIEDCNERAWGEK